MTECGESRSVGAASGTGKGGLLQLVVVLLLLWVPDELDGELEDGSRPSPGPSAWPMPVGATGSRKVRARQLAQRPPRLIRPGKRGGALLAQWLGCIYPLHNLAPRPREVHKCWSGENTSCGGVCRLRLATRARTTSCVSARRPLLRKAAFVRTREQFPQRCARCHFGFYTLMRRLRRAWCAPGPKHGAASARPVMAAPASPRFRDDTPLVSNNGLTTAAGAAPSTRHNAATAAAGGAGTGMRSPGHGSTSGGEPRQQTQSRLPSRKSNARWRGPWVGHVGRSESGGSA